MLFVYLIALAMTLSDLEKKKLFSLWKVFFTDPIARMFFLCDEHDHRARACFAKSHPMAAWCFSGPLVQSHGISCIKNNHDVIICIYIFTHININININIYLINIYIFTYIHRDKYCFFDEQCIKALQQWELGMFCLKIYGVDMSSTGFCFPIKTPLYIHKETTFQTP